MFTTLALVQHVEKGNHQISWTAALSHDSADRKRGGKKTLFLVTKEAVHITKKKETAIRKKDPDFTFPNEAWILRLSRMTSKARCLLRRRGDILAESQRKRGLGSEGYSGGGSEREIIHNCSFQLA